MFNYCAIYLIMDRLLWTLEKVHAEKKTVNAMALKVEIENHN